MQPTSELRKSRFLPAVLTTLTVLFLAAALLLLSLHLISYARTKTFFNSYLAAYDLSGNGKGYLTELDYNHLVSRLSIAAAIFGFSGIALLLLRSRLADFLAGIPAEWPELRSRFRNKTVDRLETSIEAASVLAALAIGIFLRLWHIRRAVRYDEAWTYVDYASKPLVVGLSNYHAPNNHLLNTLLVHFTTRVFGNSTLGLRLPALVAGCLVILATWFVTRALYGRLAGILAAGCVAALPTFIEFSVNARGYALQWLCILGMIWFAAALLEKPSLKIAWLGFVLTAVAGMYTIPTTLLAIAGVFAWMLWATFSAQAFDSLKSMSKKIALAGVAIGLVSAILYIPPIIARGLESVMAKDVVDWQQPMFAQGLKSTAQCASSFWTAGVPGGIVWILLAGFAAGLLLFGKVGKCPLSRNPISITISLWITAAIFVFARHIFGFPRVWSYLLLSAIMTASAGLSLVLPLLTARHRLGQLILAGVVSVALAGLIGAEGIKQRVLFTTTETGMIVDADQIVDFLSTELHPGDFLISNAIIKYEFLQRNPRLFNSLAKSKSAAHLVAVVVKLTNPTEVCGNPEPELRVAANATADTRILAAQMNLNEYTQPRPLANFATSTVYSFDRKEQ